MDGRLDGTQVQRIDHVKDVAPPSHKQARGLLLRIVSMLTKLAK